MEMFGQAQVEQEIWRLSEMLEQTTTAIAGRARTSAIADSKYKQEHAKQYLLAEGKTVGDREARAALETAEVFEAKRIGEALLLAAQEAARSYRAQLSALQTIASQHSGDDMMSAPLWVEQAGGTVGASHPLTVLPLNWQFPDQHCSCGELVGQSEALPRYADGVFVGWRHEHCE